MVGLGFGEIIIMMALLGLPGAGPLVQSQPALWLASTAAMHATPLAGALSWLYISGPPPPPISAIPPVPTVAPPPLQRARPSKGTPERSR